VDLTALLLLLLAMVPSVARAHKVTVFAWVEGDTVYTESKFSGGRPAKGARIEVYNAADEKLLEGQTDEEGRFAFQPPRPEALRVVLIAGAGHRNEWRLTAEELTGAAAAQSPAEPPVSTEGKTLQASAADRNPEALTVSRSELQGLIEAALDKKLAPIERRLGAMSDGPSFTDIVGGIGYIIGLVGLAAYLQSRRKSG
jgi:nickel transport protein